MPVRRIEGLIRNALDRGQASVTKPMIKANPSVLNSPEIVFRKFFWPEHPSVEALAGPK
jgi:hypothetical protein